jgi:hypothetical protein
MIRLVRQYARRYLDAFSAEAGITSAGVEGIGIGGAHDDTRDFFAENKLGTRRGAAGSAAWFQGDIERGLFGGEAGFFSCLNCDNFRVRLTGFLVITAAENLTVSN